jgi:hypothetical protein
MQPMKRFPVHPLLFTPSLLPLIGLKNTLTQFILLLNQIINLATVLRAIRQFITVPT